MRAIVRGLTVLALTVASALSVSSGAFAASSDPCEVANGYAAPETCKVLVEDVTATCRDDLTGANLAYAVTVEGGLAAKTVTVKFIGADGTTSSVTGQPLSGSVAWPSTVSTSGSTVSFTTETATPYSVSAAVNSVNCTSQVLAAEDPADPAAAGGVTQVLAATGAQVTPLLILAAGLLVAGGLALLVARRRRAGAR